MNRCLEVVFLFHVEKANINANESFGNVITIKKTLDFDGNYRVYISPRSMKYAVKESLKSMGYKIASLTQIQGALTTEGNPIENVDEDLFGYLVPEKPPRNRVAPIKSLGAISIHPVEISIDRGGRYDPEKRYDPAPFETEIVSAIMRSNWLIELDRIGKFLANEIKNDSDIELDREEKMKRLKGFLEALLIESSFARQTNYLIDPTPWIIAFVLSDAKRPIVWDSLNIDENLNLNVAEFLRRLLIYKDRVNKIYLVNYKIKGLEELKANEKDNEEIRDIKSKIEYKDISELKKVIEEISKMVF